MFFVVVLGVLLLLFSCVSTNFVTLFFHVFHKLIPGCVCAFSSVSICIDASVYEYRYMKV